MPEDTMNQVASDNSERFRRYNVIAVVDSLDHARDVLNGLQKGGIDASRTSLLGPTADAARADEDSSSREAGMMGDVAKSTAVGSVAGGAAGGMAGFLAGLAAFAIPGVGPAIGTGVWISTLGGAVLGGGVGGMVGGVSSISAGNAWELTYQLQEGRALVGVHSDERSTIEHARSILSGETILAIGEFDENGHRIGE
ncbi:MAG: hypothetical protein ACKVVP_19370 [Chloroflexota bacterium]